MITDIAGRRSVLFLVPAAAHSNIAVEAWEAAGQWDIQTEDGETYAVLYDAYEEHPEQRQTLTNLKSRIAAASASDAFANSRIANVSGLTQHYRDTGAYDDITPGDNDTDTFVPTEPPPVQLCKGSDAVGTSTDFHLYRECSALLGLKVELAGTTTLNWSQNLDIGSWTGGDHRRHTPAGYGSEPALQQPERHHTDRSGETPIPETLDPSNNSITGRIPASLGRLPDLATLKLSGNSLSGCIPPALRDVTTNDLATVGLSFCDTLTIPSGPTYPAPTPQN